MITTQALRHPTLTEAQRRQLEAAHVLMARADKKRRRAYEAARRARMTGAA